MKRLLPLLVVALCAGTAAGLPSIPEKNGPFLPKAMVGGRDTVQYLPDTTVLARVGNRVITAGDYHTRYWFLSMDDRPRADSLGLITFLQNLIDKEVMGLTAREINPPLEFTQRADLRQTTATVLQNTLHQRMVLDSVVVTEDDLAQHADQFRRKIHLRRILFHDRATAERVRRDLQRGMLPWSVAVKRYSQANDSLEDGDLGWLDRAQMQGEIAIKLFSLRPGQYSEVLQDAQGFHLVQETAEQEVSPPSQLFVRRMLIRDLRAARTNPLLRRMYAQARARAGMVYDSANVRWAAERFAEIEAKTNAAPGLVIRMHTRVPQLTPADTARVLARTGTRSYSLGDFMPEYQKVPPIYRRSLADIEPFIYTIDNVFLGSTLVEMALERGLDKDPLAVSQIEERRERLLVERVYQDSIARHVQVTEEMRRRYFDEREKEFMTTPGVRFAMFIRPTRAGADSVVSRLKAGTPAEAIVAEDSLRGHHEASRIRETLQGEPNQYGKILNDELEPGGSTVLGPDAQGSYLALHLIRRLPSRQMSYQESFNIVDESVQNIEAEKLVRAFLARHRQRYRIEARLELLPRVRMTDPMLD